MTVDQHDEILFHLRTQPHYSVEALRNDIEYHYGGVYHSKQSYYDLLNEARLSWHKTQVANPNRDDAQVLQKREDIKKTRSASSRHGLR